MAPSALPSRPTRERVPFDTRRVRSLAPVLGVRPAGHLPQRRASILGRLWEPPQPAHAFIQWLLLQAALLAAVVLAVDLARGARSDLSRVAGVLALVGLVLLWIATYASGRLARPLRVLEAGALFLALQSLEDPSRALGFLYVGVAFRALYGGLWEVVATVGVYVGAYVLAIVVEPTAPRAAAALDLIGLPALSGIIHFLGRTCVQLARAQRREAVLSRVAVELVGSRDREWLYQTCADAARALIEPDESGRVRLIAEASGWQVVATAGGAPVDAPVDLDRLPIYARSTLSNGHELPIAPGDRAAFVAALGALRADGQVVVFPVTVLDALAAAIVVEGAAPLSANCLETLGTLRGQLGLALRSLELHDAVARREARFQALVQNSSDLVTIVDRSARITYQSGSIQRLFGHAADALVGTSFLELLQADDASRLQVLVESLASRPRGCWSMPARLCSADGELRHVELVVQDLVDDPNVRGVLINTRDVHERALLEEKLSFQAFHDPLTGLANRALLLNRLEHALAAADRDQREISLLYVDLDGFKGVNDGLGHAVGDQVLVGVGERLKAGLRAADTVARLGGDEFAVLLVDGGGPADVGRVAARLLEDLREPHAIEGKDVVVQASIGIATRGPDERAEDLVRNADVAMYIAKARGKGAVVFFDHGSHDDVLTGLALERELPRAIARREFFLQFQPIVDLSTRAVVGLEALVRWQHPERGRIAPAGFIACAERTPHIVPLGRWVLEEACQQVADWQRALGLPQLSVSVNLSPRQLLHPTLVEEVGAALRASGLQPSRLALEITESLLVHDTEAAIQTLARLKALGVRLALDDFGTGYCSLSYLRRLPVDVLKIDKSFVAGLAPGSEGSVLLSAIVSMARTFDLEVVAEGIAAPIELEEVVRLGCTLGQGFLLAEPLDAVDAAALLAQQGAARVATMGA